jgi:hypothetical protein
VEGFREPGLNLGRMRCIDAVAQMTDPFAENVAHNNLTDRRTDETREQLMQRVLGTLNEMAGLSLTLAHAYRLLGLEPTRGARVIKQLIGRGLLRLNEEFVRIIVEQGGT